MGIGGRGGWGGGGGAFVEGLGVRAIVWRVAVGRWVRGWSRGIVVVGRWW